MPVHDTLGGVFLICFLFGAVFTFISLLTGTAHLSLPGGHGFHLAHTGGGAPAVHGGHGARFGRPNSASFVNAGSVLAFLTWFGGAGYLLHELSPLALVAVIILASLAGIAGAAVIGVFLFKVLLPAQTFVDPDDYRLEGVAGRVTVSIARNSTGEITYSRAGTRRSDAARSIDGAPIARNEEVVILAYKRGIAHVQTTAKYLASSAKDIGIQLAALNEPVGSPDTEGMHAGSATERADPPAPGPPGRG